MKSISSMRYKKKLLKTVFSIAKTDWVEKITPSLNIPFLSKIGRTRSEWPIYCSIRPIKKFYSKELINQSEKINWFLRETNWLVSFLFGFRLCVWNGKWAQNFSHTALLELKKLAYALKFGKFGFGNFCWTFIQWYFS